MPATLRLVHGAERGYSERWRSTATSKLSARGTSFAISDGSLMKPPRSSGSPRDLESAKRHSDYCPIDQWTTETFGLSFLELQAAGFSLRTGSRIGDVDATPVLIDPSYFEPTAISNRAELALDALSAAFGIADTEEAKTQAPEPKRR
jgi:hypothetical protein